LSPGLLYHPRHVEPSILSDKLSYLDVHF
jgi:hypothetical protein